MAPKSRLVYLAGYQIARDDFEVFIKSIPIIQQSLGEDKRDASFCFLAYDSLQIRTLPQLPDAHYIYGSESLGPDSDDNFSYISSVLLVARTVPCTRKGQKQDPPQETEQMKAMFLAVKTAVEGIGGAVDELKFKWHWVKKSMKV